MFLKHLARRPVVASKGIAGATGAKHATSRFPNRETGQGWQTI